MRKTAATTVSLLITGFLASSVICAQDAPPAKPKSTATTPAQGAAKTPAAKPRTGTGTGTRTATPLTLKTQKDKVSYAIGMNIGKSLHKDAVDIDPAIFARGVKDALTSAKSLLTDEEMKTVLTALQGELRKQQEDAARIAGEANKKAGEAFLAENKTKEGVYPAERAAVQNHNRGNRTEAHGQRFCSL